MKFKNLKLVLIVVMIILLNTTNYVFSQSKTTKPKNSVKIGEQEWMLTNLNVTTFRNLDPIPQAKTAEEWKNAKDLKQPAWCYYNNDPEMGKKYGKLYNWYAVHDKRGLAPEGWNIPSDKEWNGLVAFLQKDVAHKNSVRERLTASTGWGNKDMAGNGTNESGFSALPGGERYVASDNNFSGAGTVGTWWSSRE